MKVRWFMIGAALSVVAVVGFRISELIRDGRISDLLGVAGVAAFTIGVVVWWWLAALGSEPWDPK